MYPEYIKPDDNLEQMVKPLRERIVALEILLQQREMRIRHLEEQLKEKRFQPKQKEVNDEQ